MTPNARKHTVHSYTYSVLTHTHNTFHSIHSSYSHLRLQVVTSTIRIKRVSQRTSSCVCVCARVIGAPVQNMIFHLVPVHPSHSSKHFCFRLHACVGVCDLSFFFFNFLKHFPVMLSYMVSEVCERSRWVWAYIVHHCINFSFSSVSCASCFSSLHV